MGTISCYECMHECVCAIIHGTIPYCEYMYVCAIFFPIFQVQVQVGRRGLVGMWEHVHTFLLGWLHYTTRMRIRIDTRLFSLFACVCVLFWIITGHGVEALTQCWSLGFGDFSKTCLGVKTFILGNMTNCQLEAFIWAIF